MTSADVVLFLAQLVSSWAAGFTGGYVLTVFRRAIDQVA